MDPASLERILVQFPAVKISNWGIGEAKTIKDLAEEIEQEESYLRIDKMGICRVLDIVKMVIRHPNDPVRVIVEKGQYLPDGRFRERSGQVPAGKKRRNENPEQGMTREIWEELHLSQFGDWGWKEFSPRKDSSEEKVSPSFPGLLSRYNIFLFDLMLNAMPPHFSETTFELVAQDGSGTRHVFGWGLDI